VCVVIVLCVVLLPYAMRDVSAMSFDRIAETLPCVYLVCGGVSVSVWWCECECVVV